MAALANDHLRPNEIVPASGTMVLIAGLSSITGPITVAYWMQIFGLNSYFLVLAAALLLIREENIDPDNIPALSERLDHYMTEAETLSENMSAGSGAIAGIGVGDDGEPGVSPEAMKKRKRKKKKPEDGRVIISFEDHTRKE